LLLSGCLALAVLFLMADSCTGSPGAGFNPIPGPGGTPTPCAITCPPPVAPVNGANAASTTFFSLYYFKPPWTEDSSNSNSNEITLYRDTDYGQVSAQFFAQSVTPGASAGGLLSTWTNQNLDPSKFTSFQDFGPILGAEIGFNAGAGEEYGGYADLPNAPNTPLFIQVLSSVKNSTGIIFVVISPLDPSNPDPSDQAQVLSGSYDHLINTVTWK
jgi:hypothetical protein